MNEDARRFDDLDPDVKDLLRRLEPEHVETLKYVASIPRDEVRNMMKMFRDVKAVSRFMRWMIIGSVAIFLGSLALWKGILEFITMLKGARP